MIHKRPRRDTKNWGQQKEPKLYLKYKANWKHLQTGGLIKKKKKGRKLQTWLTKGQV